jgi:hypothetical protein
MKIKKPSYRKLAKMLAYEQMINDTRSKVIDRLGTELRAETKRANERVDTAMLQERIKLANALGQMMHTVTEAVKYVIGKEVL